MKVPHWGTIQFVLLPCGREDTYRNAEEKYGAALISPTNQVLWFGYREFEVGIPRADGKDMFAPFEPVWSQPLQRYQFVAN